MSPMSPSRYKYCAAALSLLAVSIPAKAEDSDKTLGTVVVTGNRGNQARTVADSPSPIDVISAAQLQASGKVGLKEQIGRAHVGTPVTNAHLVCRLLLENKKSENQT